MGKELHHKHIFFGKAKLQGTENKEGEKHLNWHAGFNPAFLMPINSVCYVRVKHAQYGSGTHHTKHN